MSEYTPVGEYPACPICYENDACGEGSGICPECGNSNACGPCRQIMRDNLTTETDPERQSLAFNVYSKCPVCSTSFLVLQRKYSGSDVLGLKDLLLRRPEGNHVRVAQYCLGSMYEQGVGGVSQNHEEAMRWFRKSADAEFYWAQNNIGCAFRDGGQGVDVDYQKAREWFGKAAAQGHAGALYNIGALYHEGKGVPQSDVRASEWYE